MAPRPSRSETEARILMGSFCEITCGSRGAHGPRPGRTRPSRRVFTPYSGPMANLMARNAGDNSGPCPPFTSTTFATAASSSATRSHGKLAQTFLTAQFSRRRMPSSGSVQRRRNSKCRMHPMNEPPKCPTDSWFFLRHGESVWNKENLFGGWNGRSICRSGRQEAQELI